jgi:hypothetical protein
MKKFIIVCDGDKNDTVYFKGLTEKSISFTPRRPEAKEINSRLYAEEVLQLIPESRNPRIIEVEVEQVFVCTIPDVIEKKAKPIRTKPTPPPNLFHNFQKLIPPKSADTKQLSLF